MKPLLAHLCFCPIHISVYAKHLTAVKRPLQPIPGVDLSVEAER